MPQYLVILSQEKTWVCFSSERIKESCRGSYLPKGQIVYSVTIPRMQ